MKLSIHFETEEFCRSDMAARMGRVIVPTYEETNNLRQLCVHVLEPIRVALQRPIRINSGLRPAWLNTAIGGASNSAHLTGRAADIECDWPNLTLAQFIRKLNLDRLDKLILEFPSSEDPRAGWVHVQVAKPGELPRLQYFTASTKSGRTIYTEGLHV